MIKSLWQAPNPRPERSGTWQPVLAALLVLLNCLHTVAWAAEAEEVPLCLTEFPPFNSETLPRQGPLIEIASEAFRRSGLKVQVQFLPWARALKDAEAARCALFGVWRNPARDQLFDYSKPMIQMELGFFGRRGVQHDFGDPKVLAGLLVGIQRGTYLPPQLEAKDLRFDLGNDLLSSLRKLLRDRVDLAYGNKALGQYLIRSEPELREELEWKRPVLEVKDHYLALSKQHPQKEAWLRAFDQGLAGMKADGSYAKILRNGGLTGWR
ncbi:transporter substrate-binding domain-containing protein [Paucibacter sp. AS339]|uniref:substrate-binding periplasmic protein n=1 Tax=Paucibacter hankyongi TaxID=3133434 RepID=UPI0030A5CA05